MTSASATTAGTAPAEPRRRLSAARFRELTLIPAIALTIIIGSIASDAFLTTNNFLNVLQQSSELSILVIAQSLVLIAGRFDLSLESVVGLAPMLVEEIFQIVKRLNEEQKLTVLLVEQNATLALAIAEHGYVMENGRIVLEGAAAALRDNADIKEFYLGLTEVGARKSYRDVKHYKRRKRWLS